MAGDNALQDYLDEDPSVLSENDLNRIASTFELPIEKVKLIAKGMSAQRKKVSSEQSSDSEGEGTGLLSAGFISALSLAHEIMRLEDAQGEADTGVLSSEDVVALEFDKQRVRDILKSEPDLVREVSELIWGFDK